MMIPGIVAQRRDTAPAVVQSQWSATNKASDVVITGSGYDVHSTAATESGGIVVSASGKSTGKFYAELSNVQSGTLTSLGVGLHRGVSSLGTYIGGNATGWGAWIEGTGGNTRRTYTNNASANSQTISFALNQRCRVAIDIDAGKIWIAHFGSSTWLGSGDPAAGTSPTYSFTPDGAAYYLAACPRSGNVSGTGNKIRLISPGLWANAAPSGFGVWTA